jgi:hypothetical protein
VTDNYDRVATRVHRVDEIDGELKDLLEFHDDLEHGRLCVARIVCLKHADGFDSCENLKCCWLDQQMQDLLPRPMSERIVELQAERAMLTGGRKPRKSRKSR